MKLPLGVSIGSGFERLLTINSSVCYMTLQVFSAVSASVNKRPAAYHFYKKSLFAVWLIALAAGWSGTAGAAEDWQESQIQIIGVENYLKERCIKFGAGEKIAWRFTSIYPLNFNIHYHPDNTTRFKIQKENITELKGEFTSDAEDHYCFTWTNLVERDAEEWPVLLEYRVLPE